MNIIESLEKLRDEYYGYADEEEMEGDEEARNRHLFVAYKLEAIIADAREEPVRDAESVLASLADCINEIARQAGTGEVRHVDLNEIREAMWRVEYRRLSLKQECDDLRLNRAALSRPSTGKLREMSCPTCCAVRNVVEVRSMMCTTCHNEFQTPEQLDAALAGEKGEPCG